MYLRQIGVLLTLIVLSVPRRLGSACVAIVGIAGAVAVLICVFAMVKGFERTVSRTGRTDRVIVIGKGAASEAASNVGRPAASNIMGAPGLAHGIDGKPIASAEVLAFVALPDRRSGLDSTVTIRGVGLEAFALRPEIRLVEGRMFRPGVREVIAGRSVQKRVLGLNMDNTLSPGGWRIVGSFESGADSHESEVLTDSDTLASALQVDSVNSVMAQLGSADSLTQFKDALAADPTLAVVALRESDYLADGSAQMRRTLNLVGYTVTGMMALGALVAALNTMYSAVRARTRELAVLRAIGFGTAPIVISVFLELLLLALLGAILGASAARLFFNGSSVSTLSGLAPSQTTFSLDVNSGLLMAGSLSAVLIAIVGGLFPAMRAARLHIAEALRAL